MKRRSRHSVRTVRMNRSAYALARGARQGGAQDLDPFGTEHFVEDCTEPLVPIVHQVLDPVDPVVSRFAQVPSNLGAPGCIGCPPSVTPPMSTFRVCRSMKNNTWSVFNRTDSTVKRSQAMIDDAWDRLNWRHVSRFGGGRRLTVRIRRIDVPRSELPPS